ncbi:MAG: universal stress protein [Flavobacteriales bacterium]|nr:universal stress protein [Flavobacteriales bacterium]
MKSILAAVDFSAVTPSLLALSCEFAKHHNAKLWLIHVAAPDPDFIGFKTGPQYIRDHRAEQLRQEHIDLQGMAAEAREKGIDSEALLLQGPTAETILAEVERLKSDMVVVGSHGHSALYRAFVGSVSEQVLRECTAPVLVVPTPNRG